MSPHPALWYMQGSSIDSAIFSRAKHLIFPSSPRQIGQEFFTLALHCEHRVWPFGHWKIGGYIIVKQTGQSRRSCMLLVDCFPRFPVLGVAAFLKWEPLNSAAEVAIRPYHDPKYAMRDSISS